ncbi:MAG: hypothetical protein K2X82_20185, partial [Gemmataceae bacterium]|nr:hypothetical protein [Gemmataceae bacterium]
MTPPPRRPDDDTPFPPLPPLPVAEPVRPDPLADDPVVAEVVESRTDDPESLPVAVPVRPPRSPDRDPPRRPRPV